MGVLVTTSWQRFYRMGSRQEQVGYFRVKEGAINIALFVGGGMGLVRVNFPLLAEGVFLRRVNRFVGLVRCTKGEVMAHVPSSGRMGELLYPGNRVWVSHRGSRGRRLDWDLLVAEAQPGILVSVDARLPNQLMADAFVKGNLPGADLSLIKREYIWGSSRFDFALGNGGFPLVLVEVKSVTLVEDGLARFPDAPTVRGVRHLQELTRWVRSGHRGMVIFVVQREDAEAMMPNDCTDPAFGQALRYGVAAGLEVLAYRCRVTLSGVELLDTLPVL